MREQAATGPASIRGICWAISLKREIRGFARTDFASLKRTRLDGIKDLSVEVQASGLDRLCDLHSLGTDVSTVGYVGLAPSGTFVKRPWSPDLPCST